MSAKGRRGRKVLLLHFKNVEAASPLGHQVIENTLGAYDPNETVIRAQGIHIKMQRLIHKNTLSFRDMVFLHYVL